jgi:hypothetical protein
MPIMPKTEEQSWSRAVEAGYPGAKGWVEVRGWEDPRPLWCIQFRNGVVFSDYTKHVVGKQAKDYACSVSRLTGEWP